MSLWLNFPVCQFSCIWTTRKDLSSFINGIDLEKHKLWCFFSIGKLVNQRNIVWLHWSVLGNCGLIRLWILCISIASVQNACNCTWSYTVVVHSLILKVIRYPSSVDKDSALLTFFINMGVEWGNNIYSFFSVLSLLDLDFTVVIENTSHLNWLEWPLILKLI